MDKHFNEYKLPKFLLSETPIKDGSYQDTRLWVTCSTYLSIMEFVSLDMVSAFASNQLEMNFKYQGEEWIGFFAQNNCNIVDVDPKRILQEAWEFYKEYLIWEDNQ